MPTDLEFTGERFLPGALGDIAYEHWHRYAFALRFVAGKRVLDVACGEGYGTALLASKAASAVGIDIDPAAVAHACAAYPGRGNLRYATGSATALPLADASVDVVVSFETIEHLPAADQPAMLAEFARVLSPDGVLVISSPNRKRYSDDRGYSNPFHLHELYRDDLARLLDVSFPERRWFHQAPIVASAVWGESPDAGSESWVGDGHDVAPMPTPEAMYYLVVAARHAGALPEARPGLSLFRDRGDTELLRAEANAREVMRLDALLRDANAAFAWKSGELSNLEQRVRAHDAVGASRDGQLAAANATLAELQAALVAQERVIEYRGSMRWWLRLPWRRAARVWSRLTGW